MASPADSLIGVEWHREALGTAIRLRGVNAMIDRLIFVGYTPALRRLSTDEPAGWLGGFKTVACWRTRGIASTRGGQEKRH